MNSKLISVIVPIYSVEDYLPKCIDSILNQSYKNLEIILVDDGSPDNCPRICDEYAKIDSRITVIHKTNGGLSSARNAGIEKATGDFLSFIDSDDWLELDMYHIMVDAIKETGSDIVTCDPYFCCCQNEDRTTYSQNTGVYTIISDNDKLFLHLIEPNPLIRFEVWNKLYSKETVLDTRFKDGQRYEDIYFDRMVLKRVKQSVSVDKALYNYRINRPGSTNSSFKKDRLSKLYEIDEYISDFKDRGLIDLSKRYQRYGAEAAIGLYRLAQINGGLKEVKEIIHGKFNDYYRGDEFRPLRHRLFHFSPELYGCLAKYLGAVK